MDSREIVILGAGKVGTHLARHLHFSGHRIKAIWSRTRESAERLAGEFSAPALCDDQDVPSGADFYIMAVPDGVIPSLVQRFRAHEGTWMHTAGSVELKSLQEAFSSCGVFYPLQTFSADRALDFKELPLLIEGSSPEITGQIAQLARSLSSRVEEVDGGQRRVIHLAAVFANNFSNHMILLAERILEENKMDSSLLHPLLQETFVKIIDLGPEAARTGPAIRGDEATMEKHLEMLKGHPELEKLYTFVSREIGQYDQLQRKT